MTDVPAPDGGIDHERSEGQRHLTYERERWEAPSEAVVRTVSSLTGTDPLELDPLYHVIDPDALDGLFHEPADDDADAELSIQFNGCTVTITRDTVYARRLDG